MISPDCGHAMNCDACAAQAQIVSPGSEEIRIAGILLVPATRELRWCLDCARLAGRWPGERGQQPITMLGGKS